MGDELLATRARLFQAFLRILTDPDYSLELMQAEIDLVVPIFERHGDQAGLARAGDFRAFGLDSLATLAAMERETHRAIEHARRAGDRRHENELLWYLLWAQAVGPTPVEAALERCREIMEQAVGDHAVRAQAIGSIAWLESARGHFDDARRLADPERVAHAGPRSGISDSARW